jgi:hypothetical protein
MEENVHLRLCLAVKLRPQSGISQTNKRAAPSLGFLRFLHASTIALDPTVVRNLRGLTDDILWDSCVTVSWEVAVSAVVKGTALLSPTPDLAEVELGSTTESEPIVGTV